MSVRAPRVLFTISALTLSAITLYAQNPPASRPASPLHETMESIGKSFKQIRAQVSDPAKNESTLALLQDMERQTFNAKSMTPRGAATRPASDQPQYLADYRTDINHMLRLELELEEHLADNKNPEAAQTVQDLVNLMEESHKQFRPKRQRPR